MKLIYKSLFSLSTILLFFNSCSRTEVQDSSKNVKNQGIPIPTQVYDNMLDEENYELRRDNYRDLVHGSMGDWKAINLENFKAKYEERMLNNSRSVISFADGTLAGEWQERGSNNVAGNVRVVDYRPSTEMLYAISDGGILWKGKIDGSGWQTLNDYYILSPRVIKVVEVSGSPRILAALGSQVVYSDDEGLSWTESSGLSGSLSSGAAIDLVQLADASGTILYLARQSGQNYLYESTDNGESFTSILTLVSTGTDYSSMTCPYGASKAYILNQNDAVYKYESGTLTTMSSGLGLMAASICQIEAQISGVSTTLYVLMGKEELYKSTDEGVSFSPVSSLSPASWNVGIQVSLDDPNTLYYGAVNTYRSTNGGVTWDLVSEWWEYYGDIPNKIHADIMSITNFRKTDGTEFTVIPNHGGINISYDKLLSTPNIGMIDLNVGQFYDVATSPINSDYIFGGTQDQGFQRTSEGNIAATSNFEQVISGDYGEMQFSHNGQALWAEYPGGDFSFYFDVISDGGPTEWYNIDGGWSPSYDWIVPSGAAPNPGDNFIYAAGGDILGATGGSHLIKLSYTPGAGILANQLDFDFAGDAGAPISSIETTPLNDQLLYVSTENGKFYRSENAGITFTQTAFFTGPGAGWIYTADIYASRLDEDLVILAGSDYGPSCVWMSTDGGVSFSPLGSGIPNTAAHEITMDPTEKFIFAATDAGPYVYSMELGEWYDLAAGIAPIQEYWTVEYVEAENIVRFATYGRGIWDFNIRSTVGIEVENIEAFSVYPNPIISDHFSVVLDKTSLVKIYNLQGQVLWQKQLGEGVNVITQNWMKKGTYLIVSEVDGKITGHEKLIVP